MRNREIVSKIKDPESKRFEIYVNSCSKKKYRTENWLEIA